MKQLTYQEINLPAVKAFGTGAIEVSLANVAAILRRWRRRSAERRRLAVLSVHLLEDAGLTEAQRYEEISKPFWRA